MTTLATDLHYTAAQLHVTAYKLRDPDTAPQAFREEVAQDLPIDLLQYQREAILEFAGEYGVYPPALLIVNDLHARRALRDMLDSHLEKHGRYAKSSSLTDHHHLIAAAIADGRTLKSIAAELNCSLQGLRTYCSSEGLLR